MKTNCLFAGVALRWRLWRAGRVTRLVSRKSRYYPGPHFLVAVLSPRTGRTRLISYIPCFPRKRVIPPIVFEGRIKWGDL